MLLFAAVSLAADCNWSTAVWNDGRLAFRHPDAPVDLATISVGEGYVDAEGFHPGSDDGPAVLLSLDGGAGSAGVLAADERVAATGVAMLPLDVLHPASELDFGPLVTARAQHSVRLLGLDGGRAVVRPILPVWFHPTGGLDESVECDKLSLSVVAGAVEAHRARPSNGTLAADLDIPVSVAPGGKTLASIRCVEVGERASSMPWEAWLAARELACPPVRVLQRTGTWRKIRAEGPEATVEGWVAAAAIGPEVAGVGYGSGGLGARLERLTCGAETLHAATGGTAFPVARLLDGAVVKRLLTRPDGWVQVRVQESEWFRAVEGELLLAPDAVARCAVVP